VDETDILHCFGSGFSKSLNIGKAIDKLQGNEREYIGIKQYAGPSGNNRKFGVGNKDEGKNKRYKNVQEAIADYYNLKARKYL
jgi:hypothetical protein